MRSPSDANAAACFPVRQTTNGATRFAKGWRPTPASRAGPIRPRMLGVPQPQRSPETNHSWPCRKLRGRVRTRLRCAAGRPPAGMAPTGSWHLGPWRLARLRNQQATDDGCCRGSGALRWGNAANGGGGARSGAAGPRRRVAATLRRWARVDDACRGQRNQRHHGQRRHSGRRYRVLSQFHAFRSMGPSQREQRRLARCRWVHAVRTADRAGRREHAAGGRLERRAELRVGGAAGGTTWLICDRAREVTFVHPPTTTPSSRTAAAAARSPGR